MSPLEDLLKELGPLLHTELAVDAKNTCLIAFGDLVKVHIEMSRDQQTILLGCRIGQLPPGSYREQILSAALKANSDPSAGVFAYSLRNQELVLAASFSLPEALVARVHETLLKLKARAFVWAEALRNQNVP